MDAERKPEETTKDRFMTVISAAQAIGRSAYTVQSLALKGELKYEVVAGGVVILRDSVEAYLENHERSDADEDAAAESEAAAR